MLLFVLGVANDVRTRRRSGVSAAEASRLPSRRIRVALDSFRGHEPASQCQ